VFKANDKPETNIVSMSLYMLFFPKILAGPIERHRLFLPQLKKPLVFDYEGVVEGGRLVLWGLFKKVVIGDTFAIMLNKVHGNLDAINGQVLLVAFLAHPIQLYFDFSGYTDIAIGLARIFGIKLSPNFNRPFLARTIGDFWRRWHISLSSWCNDFIYNRLLIKHRKWGEKAAFYSIFVCFMIIGIWHGAKWTYVVVGAFQVLALSYEFLTRKWRSTLTNKYPKALVVTASRLIVYIYVSLFLTFFFAIDVNSGFTFLYKMVSSGNLADFTLGGIYYVPEEFIIALVFAILILINEYFQEVRSYDILKLDKIPVYWRWSIYLSALFLISYFSKNESVFVYKGF
jgi:D-alanyl-lipoteichoic acid acyltransferase DltB (MBOAT superfamily)